LIKDASAYIHSETQGEGGFWYSKMAEIILVSHRGAIG